MIVCILLAQFGSWRSEANCLFPVLRVVFGWKIGFRLILFHAGMRRTFKGCDNEFHPDPGQCALFVWLMMIRAYAGASEGDCFGFMCYPRLGQAGLTVRKYYIARKKKKMIEKSVFTLESTDFVQFTFPMSR